MYIFSRNGPGRSAGIYLGERRIGFIGEIHPRVAHEFELPHAPIVFELDAEALTSVPLPSYRVVSKFQPTHRDIAVVVPAETEVEVLFDAVKRASRKDPRLMCLTDFRLFDLYRPKAEAEAHEKSLAFAVELNARGEEALAEEDVEAAMKAILEALESTGAKLRA